MAKSYSIKKTLTGSFKVIYTCPACSMDLESPLSDAGNDDTCPTCGGQHVVPGIAEKEKIERDREEEERRRQRSREVEELRRQEAARERQKEREREAVITAERKAEAALAAEADRKRRLEESAAAALKAEEQRKEQERLEQEQLRTTTTSDRILRLTFRFAKMLSVLIVFLCLLVVIGCLIRLLTLRPETAEAAAAPSFQAPLFRDLKAEMAASTQKTPKTETQQPESRATYLGPPVSRAERIERKYGERLQVLVADYQLYRDSYSAMLEWLEAVDDEHHESFVSGLERFADSVDAYMSDKSNTERLSMSRAMNWYWREFMRAIKEYTYARNSASLAELQRVAENEAARLAVAVERRMLLFVIGASLGTLLAFLVLPLLIQIERNTRSLLGNR